MDDSTRPSGLRPAAKARLEITEGPDKGQQYLLTHVTITIGRAEDCHIKPNDKEVSRSHAQIEQRDNTLWITDLNSTNGTFINGSRLSEPYRLQDGDTIKVGSTIFSYYLLKTTPEEVEPMKHSKNKPARDSSLPPEVTPARNRFSVRVSVRNGHTLLAAQGPSKGTFRAQLKRPYSDTEQEGVLKVLQAASLASSVEVSGLHREHGLRLYNALLPASGKQGADIQSAFSTIASSAHAQQQPLTLQLWFDPDTVTEAQLPWELLHDGSRHLVLAEDLHLNRYITYFGDRKPFGPVDDLRILFIISRPTDLDNLDHYAERDLIVAALQNQIHKGKVQIDVLEESTFSNFKAQLKAKPYHIVHFDGHGGFFKDQEVGVLCFEDAGEKTDAVPANQFAQALEGTGVRLVLLSACQSSTVGGTNILNSVGPALIRARVPAVIAMQFSVPIGATMAFSSEFYSSLARGESVAAAVADGRKKITTRYPGSWFFPTLYLRAADGEGYFFSAEPEAHAKMRQAEMAQLTAEWQQMTPQEQAVYDEGPLDLDDTDDMENILEMAEEFMGIVEEWMDWAETFSEQLEELDLGEVDSQPEPKPDAEPEPEQEQGQEQGESRDDPCPDKRRQVKEAYENKAEQILDEAEKKRKPYEEKLEAAKEKRKPHEAKLQNAEEGRKPYLDAQARAVEKLTQYDEAIQKAYEGAAPYDQAIQKAYDGAAPYDQAIQKAYDGAAPYDQAIQQAYDGVVPYDQAIQKAYEGAVPYDQAVQQAFGSGSQEALHAANVARGQYQEQAINPAHAARNRYQEEQINPAHAARNRYQEEQINPAHAARNRYQEEQINPAHAARNNYQAEKIDPIQAEKNQYYEQTFRPAEQALIQYDREVLYPAQQALYQFDAEVLGPAQHALQQHDWQEYQPAKGRAEQLKAQADQMEYMTCEQVEWMEQALNTM